LDTLLAAKGVVNPTNRSFHLTGGDFDQLVDIE
jgi:hypothetical protein